MEIEIDSIEIMTVFLCLLFIVHSAYEKVKHWFASHGKDLTTGACSVTCAIPKAVETMGISAPVCAAVCAAYTYLNIPDLSVID